MRRDQTIVARIPIEYRLKIDLRLNVERTGLLLVEEAIDDQQRVARLQQMIVIDVEREAAVMPRE